MSNTPVRDRIERELDRAEREHAGSEANIAYYSLLLKRFDAKHPRVTTRLHGEPDMDRCG